MQICDTYNHRMHPEASKSVSAILRCAGAKRVFDEKRMNELVVKGKLVSADQLLDQLFDPQCRPSLRWLRSQTKSKSIPHIRIGHLVFFDLEMVRTALAGKNLVRHRMTLPKVA